MVFFVPRLIGERRRFAGMSVAQVAVALDASYQVVVKYESGRVRPPVTTLARLADLFGCEPNDFFATDGSEVAA